MKKRLTYILIFSLMLFTTSGWGNVLQAAYCDPTTSVAADHMTPNMHNTSDMQSDCDTPTNCCCVDSNNSCENIDCGIGGLTPSFLPLLPIATLEKKPTTPTFALPLPPTPAFQRLLLRPPKFS
ncbi:hypothetical protein [Zhongshania sp. BJYM1]|jgi:hypothetical protein|uniref:hypothetical protein n=1 Tax=Zhongshania aquatica TaxID=2965069 RepID=UPI0022B42037|nr:hypothetical protein [Marortus sp. BJYM1]